MIKDLIDLHFVTLSKAWVNPESWLNKHIINLPIFDILFLTDVIDHMFKYYLMS